MARGARGRRCSTPGTRAPKAAARVADVLFGDVNPAGRLPITFYRSADDLPPFADYAMRGRTYRYFDGQPLYGFGYGLSYTTFRYAGPARARGAFAAVSVEVENDGRARRRRGGPGLRASRAARRRTRPAAGWPRSRASRSRPASAARFACRSAPTR